MVKVKTLEIRPAREFRVLDYVRFILSSLGDNLDVCICASLTSSSNSSKEREAHPLQIRATLDDTITVPPADILQESNQGAKDRRTNLLCAPLVPSAKPQERLFHAYFF